MHPGLARRTQDSFIGVQYVANQWETAVKTIPPRSELTLAEHASLCLVAKGFMSRAIPPGHRTRLVQLGLIQDAMGGLMATPAGRIMARM
jgi:hypothetical protein